MSNTMDRVAHHLIRNGITISAMESCTGGLFASRLTDTEGVSAIFPGSFVAYSNETKVHCGVSAAILDEYGVYSREAAAAMADACRARYDTEVGVGITGTLGNPDPNNADSTPGVVYYAIVRGRQSCMQEVRFDPSEASRPDLKERIVADVAETLAALLEIPEAEGA